MKMLVLKQLHSRNNGDMKNNTLDIKSFNNVSVVFKYSQDDRKEVEDNEILLYTTDRFICDYDFETGLKHMILETPMVD
jgi:hypothetical protein